MLLRDSTITGLNSSGLESVLCAANSSSLNIVNTTLSNNHARAVYGRNSASIVVQNSSINSNWLVGADGAGIRVDGSAVVNVINSTVTLNWASKGNGAGVYVSADATAVINSSKITHNFCDALQGGAGGLGGGLAAVGNATVIITGSSVLEGNFADVSGAGIFTTDRATLSVSPEVLFGSNQVRGKAFGYDLAASGSSILYLPPADFTNHTFDTLAWISKCSKGVSLDRTPCESGELTDSRSGVCVCCPERSFSFDTSGVCRPCPERALCPGGDVVQPLPGFWRSSAQSAQVHKCPLLTVACAGKDACQPGYTGNLCGACAQGYGHVSPLTCTRCMQPGLQLGLYVAISSVTLFFVTCTVHFTYKDNVEGSTGLRPSDLIKLGVQFLQYLVIIGAVAVPWPDFMQGLFRSAAVVFGVGAGQALSLDCWLSHYAQPAASSLPRAMQLQLVVFLAPSFVLLAICMGQLLVWALQRCMSTTASSASPLVGMCSLRCSEQAVSKPALLRDCVRKLPLAVLVVVYYAYPTLLRASLSFFGCLSIDSVGTASESTPALRGHQYGYSVLDIQQQCFVGWHKLWALGLVSLLPSAHV